MKRNMPAVDNIENIETLRQGKYEESVSCHTSASGLTAPRTIRSALLGLLYKHFAAYRGTFSICFLCVLNEGKLFEC